MADDGFGFDDAGGGDDFGFDDEFGQALDDAEQSTFAEVDKEKLDASFKELPEADDVAHSPEPEEEYVEDDEVAEDTTPRQQREAKITGEKSGWMKMLNANAGLLTLGKKAWREKWFILKGGKFHMAAGPGPAAEAKKVTIDLTHAQSFEKDPGDDADTFTLITKKKTFFFKTRSPKDCVSWVDNLVKAKANYLGSFSSGSRESNSSLLF